MMADIFSYVNFQSALDANEDGNGDVNALDHPRDGDDEDDDVKCN